MAIQVKNDNVLIGHINELENAIDGLDSRLDVVENDFTTLSGLVGGGSLSTTSQTLIGAINEIHDGYLPLTGGTLTGRLTILGTALDHLFKTCGIWGINTDGTDGDLYIGYNGGTAHSYVTYFGYANGGSISADGTYYSGKSETSQYTVSPYYYSSKVMTQSITADTLFGSDAKINKMSCGFMESGPFGGYADIIYYTGYCKWGGTELATEYNAVTPRLAIRKYVQSKNGWGNWAIFTSSSSSSTFKVKENILDMKEMEALKLLDIKVKSFDYKEGYGEKNQFGCIAEDVKEIIPFAVSIPKDYDENKPIEENNVIPSIDYSKFIPYIIKMIQIQQKEIDSLKKE